jgi:protein SCO1
MVTMAAAFTAAMAASMAPAEAHSLAQLDAQLQREEKFFQPVDRAAPDFSLQDADGKAWTLERLRGKVVVLNFIYAGCKDLCPLHRELIARSRRWSA